MDDDVLLRAKALVAAMNSMQGTSSASSAPVETVTESPSLPKFDSLAPEKSGLEVRGAAIHGSSLVTTFEDIRPLTTQGSVICIDGNPVKTSSCGEWSANRVELEQDFSGETNFSASITFPKGSMKIKKTRRPASPKPVASADILKAVEALSVVNEFCFHKNPEVASSLLETSEDPNPTIPKPSNKKRSKLPTMNLNKTKKQQSNSSFLPSLVKATSSSPREKRCEPARDILRIPVAPSDKGANESEEDGTDAVVDDSRRLTQRPLSGRSTNPTPRQKKHHLDNEKNGNVDGIGRGPNPVLRDALADFSCIANAHMLTNHSEQRSAEERRARILARMKQKLRDEELEKQREKASELLRLEAARQANEIKIAKLKAQTAARVSKLQEDKLREEEQERIRQEQFLAMKREKEQQLHSEEMMAKLRLMKAETASRLRRQEQEMYSELEAREAEVEAKLKKLAEVRGRLVPTVALMGAGSSGSGTGAGDGGVHGEKIIVETNFSDGSMSIADVADESTTDRKNNILKKEKVSKRSQTSKQEAGKAVVGSLGTRESVSEGKDVTLRRSDKPSYDCVEMRRGASDTCASPVKLVSDSQTMALHPLPEPVNINSSSSSSSRLLVVQKQASLEEDDDMDGLLSDITAGDSSPKSFRRNEDLSRGEVSQQIESSGAKKKKKKSEIWRKLKPIPIQPYMEVPL